MKRPAMSIAGRLVSPAELRSEISKASNDWLRDQREEKLTIKRRHRALSQTQREAKAQATAAAKKKRADEREGRELERLLQRVGYLSKRNAREAEAMTRVHVRVPLASAPRFATVCPRALYSQLNDEVSRRKQGATKRSRVAADGYKNIVLRKHSRGFGRKSPGTRGYRMGEAADLARYILRDEGLEPDIQATFTNVIEFQGSKALYNSQTPAIDAQRASQIAAFWNALEILESEADADGNVFSHLILAMPHELSPEGRSRALGDLCLTLRSLRLPFVAALHKPDEDGDARNFHAHLMLSPRPFAVEGAFEWSYEAAKATELNLPAGISWLRERAAESLNRALEQEGLSERYTGISQARRGVAATGETHDGPAVTARKRRLEGDERERRSIVEKLSTQVAERINRQRQLEESIEILAERVLPPALAAMKKRFPDPKRLHGLEWKDFLQFTESDRRADQWYAPSMDFQIELETKWRSLIGDDEGRPVLKKDNLDERFRPFADQTELPDIVNETIAELHRRLLDERDAERKAAAAKRKKIAEEQGRIRLTEPITVFSAAEYERLNDKDKGAASPGVHVPPPSSSIGPEEVGGRVDTTGMPHSAKSNDDEGLARPTRSPSEATDGNAPGNPPSGVASEQKPQQSPAHEDDDDNYFALLQAAMATGKAGLPGKSGPQKG